MLTTKQPVLRRFWYATIRIDALANGPKPFRLMGEDIVLFLDAEQRPHALQDRCCHRTAKLSKGWCDNGTLVCGYHGWRYDGSGAVVGIPQSEPGAALPRHRTKAYFCQERFGYAWVALEAPLADLFDIPEDADPTFRRIFQFDDTWQTGPLRFMENSFDNAHFAFVHRGTFGDMSQPKPRVYRIEETAYGFQATTVVEVVNPPHAFTITRDPNPTTTRTMHNHWYLPFCRRMDMHYPSGIRHIIINCAPPSKTTRSRSFSFCSATIPKAIAAPRASSPGTGPSSRKTARSSKPRTATPSSIYRNASRSICRPTGQASSCDGNCSRCCMPMTRKKSPTR